MRVDAQKIRDGKKTLYVISVDEEMVLSLIESMISQVIGRNPNTGRKEYYTTKGEYFCVFVDEFKPTKREMEKAAQEAVHQSYSNFLSEAEKVLRGIPADKTKGRRAQNEGKRNRNAKNH